MLKLMSTVSCAKISNLLNNMLSNRFFQVFLRNQSSRWRRSTNNISQGSVLAPIIQPIYVEPTIFLLESCLNSFISGVYIQIHQKLKYVCLIWEHKMPTES
jgi:hypothetical protein